MSVEVAMLHELPKVLDRSLASCLELTSSKFGFVGLLDRSQQMMDVAAIRGFEPTDPTFYERFRQIPLRPNLFGVVIRETHTTISNDVINDPRRVGQPRGHPQVRTFLGAPLRVGTSVIGMIGVANRDGGYVDDDARLLFTFANQTAVAIENARLYELQRNMIDRLAAIDREREQAELERLIRQERERIAAEVHDRIDQGLFAVGLRVNAALTKGGVTGEAAARLIEMRELLAQMAQQTKQAVFAMSAGYQPEGPLVERLQSQAREVAQGSGLEVNVLVTGRPVPLRPTAEQALYHVVRSSLLNAITHARARTALVTVDYGLDAVEVTVQDDGADAPEEVAIDTNSASHFGLRSMKNLVEDSAGTFTVRRGDEGGLVVRARVPVLSA